ncbi:hypothetical protein J1N35_037912 [Gossypium stocksii]|uniref:Uncharacterized protein n=1 Tax=Gossypium stocksii TaxID=47602 RepID=A0A9D3UKT6_9ROSI|nr:hypothetical protein J1N35_037912 [Gossypium stocksii]
MWSYKSMNRRARKNLSVLNFNLLAWQGRRGPFKVHKQGGQGTVGSTKLRCENHGDLKKSRKKFQKKGQPNHKASQEEAKATRGLQGELSQYHSRVTMRVLREWMEENVTGQSAKPVIVAQDAPHEGLSIRWGSFSPRELA